MIESSIDLSCHFENSLTSTLCLFRDHSKKVNDKAALEKNLMQLQRQQEHSRDSYHVFGVEFEGLVGFLC